MNKEQFKALILGQFNNPNSDIWALMYDFCRPWSKDNGRFTNRHTMKSEEFNLIIEIEKEIIDDNTQNFHVNMIDQDDYSPEYKDAIIQEIRDLKYYDYFYQESIDYQKGQLIFKVDILSLKEKNYQFYLIRRNMRTVYYDLVNRQFKNKQEAKIMMDYIYMTRGNPANIGPKYNEISLLEPDIEKIVNKAQIDKGVLPIGTKEFIEEALENGLQMDEYYSFMYHVMNQLIRKKELPKTPI